MAIDGPGGVGGGYRPVERATPREKVEAPRDTRVEEQQGAPTEREAAGVYTDSRDRFVEDPAAGADLKVDDPGGGGTTVEQQASELIQRHTNWFGLNLDESGLGQELAEMATEDPAGNLEVIKEVYDQLGSSWLGGDNKEQVALEMVKALSDEELSALAATSEGAQVLLTADEMIRRHGVSGKEAAQVDRLHDVLQPRTLEQVIEGLQAGRTDDAFRDGVAELFGPMTMDQAHDAMQQIRDLGLQRQLIDSVVRDSEGNQADARIRDGIETMLNTGKVDFFVGQLASDSFTVFDGAVHDTGDPHFWGAAESPERGVYIPVGRANDTAELPRTLVHEIFHAYASDHGSAGGALEEGMGISLIHYAYGETPYNMAEAVYGTKNWYRDSRDPATGQPTNGNIAMGDFSNADAQLREVLEALSVDDESHLAWDDNARLQREYRQFWMNQDRFGPPSTRPNAPYPNDDWFTAVPKMTQDMLDARLKEQMRHIPE
jgi:hypothetical protein